MINRQCLEVKECFTGDVINDYLEKIFKLVAKHSMYIVYSLYGLTGG